MEDPSSEFFGMDFKHISSFQLDIVGFLAILGEGAVQANAEVAALSQIVFLPRLLPAPQALMKPSRAEGLPPLKGWVTAVHSGNNRDYINYVGNVLLDAESLPAYSVRCIEIVRKQNREVQAKVNGPLGALAILGFLESLALCAYSWWHGDGVSMLATLCLSLLSTLIGVGNKWTLNLPKRRAPNPATPPGDVVVRYPKGSFVVVQCHEDVARELFFAPEDVDYFIADSWKYRLLSLGGTALLILGVICLGNASTDLQVAFAAAYILLNAMYWIVAALPPQLHWDMSCFEIKEQGFEADLQVKGKGDSAFIETNSTFTQALWKVVAATKDIDWVAKSATAPQTRAWDEWLKEAKKHAVEMTSREENLGDKIVKVFEMPEWDPQKALISALREYSELKVKEG